MPLLSNYTERFDNDQLIPVFGGHKIAIQLAASGTYLKGALLMQTGTSGVYTNYDGATSVPVGVLDRNCVTDANGNITFGSQASGMEFGQTSLSASMFVAGVFNSADLQQTGTGEITAGSVTPGNAQQFARLLQGTIANGLVKLL